MCVCVRFRSQRPVEALLIGFGCVGPLQAPPPAHPCPCPVGPPPGAPLLCPRSTRSPGNTHTDRVRNPGATSVHVEGDSRWEAAQCSELTQKLEVLTLTLMAAGRPPLLIHGCSSTSSRRWSEEKCGWLLCICLSFSLSSLKTFWMSLQRQSTGFYSWLRQLHYTELLIHSPISLRCRLYEQRVAEKAFPNCKPIYTKTSLLHHSVPKNNAVSKSDMVQRCEFAC